MITTLPHIRKFVVIGIGLIGGSLASALRQSSSCDEIIGVARNEQACLDAVSHGVVDRAVSSLSDIASELDYRDMIFIAVPTLSVEKVLAEIAASIDPAVTITDGASVKGSIADAARRIYGIIPPQLVLGHPIAGSEKSGVFAANPELYINHRVILTPLENTSPEHFSRVKSMWESAGAEVLSMSVEEHDEVLAATSHLPHVIAYSLVDTLAHDILNPNIFRYAAGGFRDFTRIASSDPVMWHDIMRANRMAILKSIDLFIGNLTNLREAIDEENSDYLLDVFSRAKEARDEYTRISPNLNSRNEK